MDEHKPKSMIEIIKEAGYVMVVRCKDCKQSGIDSTSYPQYWCPAHAEYHDGEWFCADGEWKSD